MSKVNTQKQSSSPPSLCDLFDVFIVVNLSCYIFISCIKSNNVMFKVKREKISLAWCENNESEKIQWSKVVCVCDFLQILFIIYNCPGLGYLQLLPNHLHLPESRMRGETWQYAQTDFKCRQACRQNYACNHACAHTHTHTYVNILNTPTCAHTQLQGICKTVHYLSCCLRSNPAVQHQAQDTFRFRSNEWTNIID